MKRIAFASSALLFAIAGAVAAACSDNANTNLTPTTTLDSGSGSSGDAGAGDAGDAGDDGSSDAASTCKIPKLHVTAPGDVFCGYDDAGSFSCSVEAGTSECCLGGEISKGNFAPQQCQAFGSACTNPPGKGLQIECSQIADCTANGIVNAACCLQGAMGSPAPETGCPADDLKLSGGSGIVCEPGDAGIADAGAPACSGGIQICSQNADCPNGMTCTPMHWKLYELGFCK